MNKLKKLLSYLFVVVLALSMVVLMTACKDKSGEESGESGVEESGPTGTYTVSLKTAGGMAMSGIDVYIYADEALTDLKQYGTTNEAGQVSFDMAKNENYAISLSGIPKGYDVASSYKFSGNAAEITLTSALISGEDLSGASLGLGDVMYDFTVTTPDGIDITLSEVLKEKDMVLLNFWYTTCTWCVTEFPLMEEAYQTYKEDIEIIALDPMNDGNVKIQNFQDTHQLSFPMAECPTAWSQTFGISGYPTSIAIDRYGVICMVEAGAITSLRPFMCAFDHFIGDDYEQKLCVNGVADLVTQQKPNVTMDTSENIGALINKGDINVTYRPEEDEGAEYTWPFVATEKNDVGCLKASNQQIDESYAIIYADVELKKGQALGFDYLVSSERYSDFMVVIVNDEDIFQISGVDEVETWKSCYPCVAEEDGVYEVALCYLKDGSTNVGDDTVYIKDMRVVDADEIDVATYLPREVASSKDGFEFNYVDVVFNTNDGYYHVGTANGPLLLADLMGATKFNEEESIYMMGYNGKLVLDGHDYYEELVDYCNMASNSSLEGICTVNKELGELLKITAQIAGFDGDENEWLKTCRYFQAYGTDGEQLEDPVKGLAPFSAYEAKLGKNVSTNYFEYDRIIMPRGKLAEFIPSKSGVYRITSRTESTNGVDAWIFDENHKELLTYEQDERMFNDNTEVSMVYYMEAGKAYYIDIAFWDVYETGYIYYDIEYLGATRQHFRLASHGYFTYDSDATGEQMYHVIAGGIKAVLKADGYYYEDLGKDADGKQLYGSLIYADFTGLTTVFSDPISSVYAKDENGKYELDENGNKILVKGMIDKGGFDFSKTEEDLYILGIMASHDNDVEATEEYLKEMWGDTYEQYAEIYQVEDVFAGRYHGKGEDYTDDVKAFLDDIITSGPVERQGCVAVTEELAELLQKLMDKYTFEDVDQSWLKLCYYYDYLGPNA